MNPKEPVELALKILENKQIVRNNEFRFICSDFGFVNSFSQMEPTLVKIGQPYRMKEGRIVFVKAGSAKAIINLIESPFVPNVLSLIAPNSIIQLTDISPDFDAQMIAIDNHFLPVSWKEDFFTHFLQRRRNLTLTLTTEEQKQLEDYFRILWNILQAPVFRREAIQHLLVSLLYNIEYIVQSNHQTETQSPTRQQEVFQRFISLVNTYSKQERNVSFYADKLCLTPRYLNTVIRENSRQTVMDWINQSIILEAKVMLKHSNHLVYQISDELNFPNPSFFCKFFKRMTGMTPQEYQKR